MMNTMNTMNGNNTKRMNSTKKTMNQFNLKMECENCFIDYSPQWRTIDKKCYCNSCGVRYFRWKSFKPVEEIYAKILINISKGK